MSTAPKPYRMLRDVLDLAMQTGAPLIVRRRCNPHQLAVWMAVRFLIDTSERTAFGSREIADEAGLKSYPRVPGWLDDLVKLELLEIIGHESVPGMQQERPIYRIPWKRIFSDSLIEAEKYVAGTANKRKRGRPPEGHELQLPIDFPAIDRSQPTATNGSQSTVIDRSQPTATNGSQALLPMDRSTATNGSQSTAIDRSHGMDGRMDGGMEAPPAPLHEPGLEAHPLRLWRDACPQRRRIDDSQILLMAAEHDAATGGYGLYWCGRAILAAALVEPVRGVAKVRNILDRWRREASYGSDLARKTKEPRHEQPPHDTRSRADQRPRSAPMDGAGPPAGLKRARAVGSAPATTSDADG